jgi:hypothetical protein
MGRNSLFLCKREINLKTPLDIRLNAPYNKGVFYWNHMTAELLESVVVDICTRSFLLLSDQGDEKFVSCEQLEEFTNVLNFVKDHVSPERIEYADLAVAGETHC